MEDDGEVALGCGGLEHEARVRLAPEEQTGAGRQLDLRGAPARKGATEPDPKTGLVMDLKDLEKIIEREVIEPLDHHNLNLDVTWLQGIMPSIENVVVAIWERIEPHLPKGAQLHKITLWETQNNFVEYFGEQ